ncbi:alkaline phosphatase family protein [Sporichthya sp.]|uniref:alkaline phosphatase family protein n=1 Tax=Sporichthya sp. TaxID=65475 RepID=UPI001814C5EB|nr:nucleotide pyrophosphatase/phosphodiesterase family protein [Sporichthya sp.]MBA3744902.1 alkaline phosphatase family protein [Sporichthya sp.]
MSFTAGKLAYGTAGLPDLLPSVLGELGVPGESGPLALDLPSRVAVLLVDGLGLNLLRAHTAQAPYLASLLPAANTLAVGFPSTTATSLTSLGTGLPPGAHGVLGLSMRGPDGSILNALHWDAAKVDPNTWQPHPTAFERAAAAGIEVRSFGPGRFRGSGLNGAAFRGVTLDPAESAGELAAATLDALADRPARDRVLAYTYYGDLDATGHRKGVGSAAWRHQLAHVDRLAEQIGTALPPGSALLITADHGMVDLVDDERIDVDAEPELRDGVELIAGEPRARYVHAVPGAAADVLATWRARLKDGWIVLSRTEAVEAGWFGRVDGGVLERIGDVVAIATGAGSVVASKSEPSFLAKMIGMHGSLSEDELLVPLMRASN